MIPTNRKLRITVVVAAGVAAVLGWWLALAPRAIGGPNTYVTVATNSATPRYRSGDILIVRRSDYHVGQVVVEASGSTTPTLVRVAGGNATEGWRISALVGLTSSPARVANNRILGSPWLVIGGYKWLHWVLAVLAAAVAVALFFWPAWWRDPLFGALRVRRPSRAERLSLQFLLPLAWVAFLGADYSFTDREAGINRISFAGRHVATLGLGTASLLFLTASSLAAVTLAGRLFAHRVYDIVLAPEHVVDLIDTSDLLLEGPAPTIQSELIVLTDEEAEQVIDLRVPDPEPGDITARPPNGIQPSLPPGSSDITTLP